MNSPHESFPAGTNPNQRLTSSPPSPSRRGRHVRHKSQACTECRKRKCKCDGSPGQACTRCVAKGFSCKFVEDGRRRNNSRLQDWFNIARRLMKCSTAQKDLLASHNIDASHLSNPQAIWPEGVEWARPSPYSASSQPARINERPVSEATGGGREQHATDARRPHIAHPPIETNPGVVAGGNADIQHLPRDQMDTWYGLTQSTAPHQGPSHLPAASTLDSDSSVSVHNNPSARNSHPFPPPIHTVPDASTSFASGVSVSEPVDQRVAAHWAPPTSPGRYTSTLSLTEPFKYSNARSQAFSDNALFSLSSFRVPQPQAEAALLPHLSTPRAIIGVETRDHLGGMNVTDWQQQWFPTGVDGLHALNALRRDV